MWRFRQAPGCLSGVARRLTCIGVGAGDGVTRTPSSLWGRGQGGPGLHLIPASMRARTRDGLAASESQRRAHAAQDRLKRRHPRLWRCLAGRQRLCPEPARPRQRATGGQRVVGRDVEIGAKRPPSTARARSNKVGYGTKSTTSCRSATNGDDGQALPDHLPGGHRGEHEAWRRVVARPDRRSCATTSPWATACRWRASGIGQDIPAGVRGGRLAQHGCGDLLKVSLEPAQTSELMRRVSRLEKALEPKESGHD